MRTIVQRVKEANVSVEAKEISSIGEGLLVLLGVGVEDDIKDAEYIASKLVGLRVFDDEDGVMNLSLEDVNGEILIVSQFTLYGDVRKGRRPSYINSAKGDVAVDLYEKVCALVGEKGFDVKKGQFGADMDISLVNSGPVTIQLDSSKLY